MSKLLSVTLVLLFLVLAAVVALFYGLSIHSLGAYHGWF